MTSKLTKNRIYLIIFTGFMLMFLSSSVKNVFQVWFVDICTSFGITRSEFSFSGTAFMLVTGVGSWIAGILSDRIGASRTILIGCFFIAMSFIGSALVANFYFFVAMYGGVAALALAAIQYVPMGVLVDQTFSGKNKGIVYALLVNGTGLGFVILSPLWVHLNLSYSWQQVYIVVGCVFLLLVLPMVYFTLPKDDTPKQKTNDQRFSSRREMWINTLSQPAFWFIAMSFFGCGVNMAFIDIHFVPMMQDANTAPTVTGLALSILGALEMVGGFVAGWLTGRMKPALLLSGFYALRAVSGWLLMNATDEFTLIAFSAIFGMTYLGTVIVTSLFCLSFFGAENKASVFGLVFFIHQIGAALSTWAGAHIFDSYGNYTYAVAIAVGFSILSALLALGLFTQGQKATGYL